jgi:hypothetical protein
VLQFIYTQKIQNYPNDEESLMELLRISKICKISNLIEILSLKLIKFLKFSNSLKMIEFCVEFDIHNYLEKKSWEILKNSSKDDLIQGILLQIEFQVILENQLKHSSEISELSKKVEKSERVSYDYHQVISQSQQQIQLLQRQLKKFMLQNSHQ